MEKNSRENIRICDEMIECFSFQKFAQKGKLAMPFAFGPMIGNCFITCLLNEPVARENMADIYA